MRPMKPFAPWSSLQHPAASMPQRLVVAAASVVALGALASPATAQDAAESSGPGLKLECARAFEQSQRLRNAAQYLAATREVLKCTNPACGEALSEECGKIYSELQLATPSVVFGARDAQGRELTDVEVATDDSPTGAAIDGKPVPIDPGAHTFVFSAAGFEPVRETVVVRTGERFRPIAVTLERPRAEGGGATAQVARPMGEVGPPRASGVPLGSYVLGGVAALGFGSFVGLRIWGGRDYDALARDCKPNCEASAVDSVKQKYVVSNIALAVGSAALVAGVTVYLASPKTSPRAAMLQVWPSRDGVSARIAARF